MQLNVSEKNNIQVQINDFLYKRSEISFAYIFGSFIQRDHYHDIDIAVYLLDEFNQNNRNKFPYGYASMISGNLMKLLHMKKVDVILLNNSPLLITNRIINTGKLLFDKNKYKRIEFENYNRKMFIDTENFRKIRTYYLVNKINNYA
jgi:uncharacterized protein